jgi:hypothetical protein
VDADELVIESPRTAGPRFDVGLALQVAWIAVRLIAVFYLGQQGAMFFYQGF